MKTVRIIPRLDIKGPNLVKGIHLEGLRVLGTPSDFARYYYLNGADELLFMDVVASLYERNSLHDIISETAKEIFIPITVGGGIRTLSDIQSVLRAGADKVAINTAAIKTPELLREASREFGSSTIVVAIEAIKQDDGKYCSFIDNGREYTGLEVEEWAKRVEDLGCGEIIITSVDRDGTGKGFDTDLAKLVSECVTIPVIIHGGAGNKNDVLSIFKSGDINSISIASLIHYDFIRNNKFAINELKEGNFEFLKSGRQNFQINAIGIQELKEYLRTNNIDCR